MPETTTEKAVCGNCDAEVREGTSFCYNCGKPVSETPAEPDLEAAPEPVVQPEEEAVHSSNGSSPAVSDEARAALDDLAHRLSIDETTTEENKLAQAAAERKRARLVARRSELVWEPATSTPPIFYIFTLLIVILTALIVFTAVYWK